MDNDTNIRPPKHIIIITVSVVILIILALIFFSWILTRGVDDDAPQNAPTSEQQPAPANTTEPSNPNVTGGSSAGGTGNSNDPSAPTPSPAGGVDTNQMPAQ